MEFGLLLTILACVVCASALRIFWRAWLAVYFSPSAPTSFHGHARQVCRSGNARVTRDWAQIYGQSILCRWLFMLPCLGTADPEVVRHILYSNKFTKPWEAPISAAQIVGNSVLMAEGERDSSEINPAFGSAQIRELFHIVFDKAAELRDIWADELTAHNGPIEINVLDGIKKMTLDVIGLARFDYHLEALNAQGMPNELCQAFQEIFNVSPPLSVFRIIMSYLPSLDFFPDARTKTVRKAHAVMRRTGIQLIRDKKAAVSRALAHNGGAQVDSRDVPGRDLLSLLTKATMATNIPDNQRLSDEEVLSRILHPSSPNFLIAGYETTSTAAAWCLFAFTHVPAVQKKPREELLGVQANAPSMEEHAALPYLDAVVRETLRLHAPVTFTLRSATADDVLPVSAPFVDRTGVLRHDIRPERWASLPDAVSRLPGVWAHMLTFSGGAHARIGYRFSLAELKALVFTLVRAFGFELAADPEGVTCVGMFTQRPALSSELARGAQLPLMIRPHVRT
ncbi:cytochrome P450 [Trametes elegans]|nr:cytochrome P450 [Trametes elegans]